MVAKYLILLTIVLTSGCAMSFRGSLGATSNQQNAGGAGLGASFAWLSPLSRAPDSQSGFAMAGTARQLAGPGGLSTELEVGPDVLSIPEELDGFWIRAGLRGGYRFGPDKRDRLYSLEVATTYPIHTMGDFQLMLGPAAHCSSSSAGGARCMLGLGLELTELKFVKRRLSRRKL